MARTTKNVLGNQSGRIGQVVGMITDGVQLYRSYTDRVRNPRTKAQQLTRAKLGEFSLIARGFKSAIALGFKNSRKPLESVQNVFIRKNQSAMVGDTPSEIMFDYTQAKISEGAAVMAGFGSIRADEALTVDETFVPNSDIPGASSKDKVYMCLFQPDTKACVLSMGVLRSAGTISISVPSGWSGMKVHGYGFVVAAEDVYDTNGVKLTSAGECSVTAYLGSATIV